MNVGAPVFVGARADDTIRWKSGERLQHLFEQRCDQLEAEDRGDTLAVVDRGVELTFRDLDNRANQVARFLIKRGLRAGDRVGLLFDKTAYTYIALLAVLKVNAAYVPLDVGFPNDRAAFILKDAGVKAIVSLHAFRSKLGDLAVAPIYLDLAGDEIDRMAATRLRQDEIPGPVDQLAYVVYTSGTTGTPKGVAIEHASICNFVRVAAEVYGMRRGDRCYQGMTIAFDFSVEELWVPLVAGATLVPATPGSSLVGAELADFLSDNHVTVLCCVPTLLATIERNLPHLRLLLVSGEACPHNLVVRWHRAGRTILNAYGPTEATVTATLTELNPDKPVTIGRPLPTYKIVILDAHKDNVVGDGDVGEIGIAGIGLAAGYLNRDDLTRKKFIADFLDLPNNPSKRIYRTGDLGRINERGEIEFLGRIDTQVKIRGYRIELAEIESALMQLPQIAQAVVSTYEPEAGLSELVAYYTLKNSASAVSRGEIMRALRSRLPSYMVPAFLEQLATMPMSVSTKADRAKLPPPTSPRFVADGPIFVAPRTPTENALTRALSDLLKVERISTTDNFFEDLGGHSLLMARFASVIRQNLESSGVSMSDIYGNPTIEKLAGYLDTIPAEQKLPTESLRPHVPTRLSYVTCGVLQLGYYAAYLVLASWLFTAGFKWTFGSVGGGAGTYIRLVAFAATAFVILNAVPIAAKWILIGRWKAEAIPIWSLRYFRFWVVKNLVRSAPIALFVGTPLYNIYLRLLGARIGRNTVIWTKLLPICTDLISIGNDTIVRKDSLILGYKAQSNWIHTGPVHIGARAFVGEATVLDIDTTMEDDTQLGHSSSLQSGQQVPTGKHFHGSPAIETNADYFVFAPGACSALRRAAYSMTTIAFAIAVVSPLAMAVVLEWLPSLVASTNGYLFGDATKPNFLIAAGSSLAGSLVTMISALVIGFFVVTTFPKALWRLLEKDRTYVLYGFRYFIYRAIFGLSNSRVYNLLFGDSSFIVFYLRRLGYQLNLVQQTGSNFGTNQKHEVPFLCDIGSGTMVSDGLSMMNAEISSSSFTLREVRIGANNYLGNDVHYPASGRTGANCLLATKVLVPVEGPVRENVGLLGSPSFAIPRAVARDRGFSMIEGEQRQQRILEKNRHNIVTVILFLTAYWAFLSVSVLAEFLTLRVADSISVEIPLVAASISCFAIGFFAVVERASLGFRKLEPKIVSIYDPYFWFHERHWKLCESPLMSLFKGTPFKNAISRLLGVKVGRMVFDDGCQFLEKTLIEIGDYSNLNEACVLQGHSLEEGAFKSDHIRIGKACSIGCAAFVHYGVQIGDNAVLAPDSFLMKGEIVEPETTWQGNPAKSIAKAKPSKEGARLSLLTGGGVKSACVGRF